MKRRQQKQRPARRRRKERPARPGAVRARSEPEAARTIDLAVRHPELAHPPVHIDAWGTRIPDPFACLGLDPAAPLSQATVQAAFRRALAETPPEQDPRRARERVEARDLLLAPGQVLTRALGDLRVPRAEHFVPGHERQMTTPTSAPSPAAPTWSSRSRLVAILSLYALLEEELEAPGDRRARTGMLFE